MRRCRRLQSRDRSTSTTSNPRQPCPPTHGAAATHRASRAFPSASDHPSRGNQPSPPDQRPRWTSQPGASRPEHPSPSRVGLTTTSFTPAQCDPDIPCHDRAPRRGWKTYAPITRPPGKHARARPPQGRLTCTFATRNRIRRTRDAFVNDKLSFKSSAGFPQAVPRLWITYQRLCDLPAVLDPTRPRPQGNSCRLRSPLRRQSPRAESRSARSASANSAFR